MTVTTENQDSSETPTQISSPDASAVKREKFGWIRQALERGVAIASFAFVLIAFQKFVPSTSGVIESKISAVGMAFMGWIKFFSII
jgi:hypothetical protein